MLTIFQRLLEVKGKRGNSLTLQSPASARGTATNEIESHLDDSN